MTKTSPPSSSSEIWWNRSRLLLLLFRAAFGSSTNEDFDGERESLAESNSLCSRLCAFIDENEITDVVTIPPSGRALNGSSNKKLLVLDLNRLLADIVPLQHVPYGLKVDAIILGERRRKIVGHGQ
ncbi:uncharacterized protein LOC107860842 [Capsicum annuum]|uniref:uncharacterized protein LOC107860842 n=1 Tax=Capsicum annuum TaxID=4072 RepID=UPI001FB1087D|nr:uncharacterized protein LOC107860842 [Capsicum annuum]